MADRSSEMTPSRFKDKDCSDPSRSIPDPASPNLRSIGDLFRQQFNEEKMEPVPEKIKSLIEKIRAMDRKSDK